MPPRKRAAHLKKLADAKVAKVAKEEQAQSSHNALFNPGKVAPPPASEDSQPSKKARLGRPPGSRDSEQRTRRTGDGVTLSLLSSHLSPLCSALFSLALLSPLLSFPSPRVLLGSPRLSPVFCLIVCSLSFPHVPPLLSLLFLSPSLPVVRLLSSLPAPRSSRNCACCSSCLSARQISLRKATLN